MTFKDNILSQLDTNAGPDKVRRAHYSPKALREGSQVAPQRKAGIVTWIIVACVIMTVVTPVIQPFLK